MGEIVPGNGKYGAAGFFATERALSYVLVFACVAVVFTCAFLVWRDVEPPPAEAVEASRSVTVELDLRRPPVASPSAVAAAPSGAPSTAPSAVTVASPVPSAAPRTVAVAGVPAGSRSAAPSPVPAEPSPRPSPEASGDGSASPSPEAAPSPSPAPAAPTGAAPRAAAKGAKPVKAARPVRVAARPSGGTPGSRRTVPPVDTLQVPNVSVPAGTTPPSWQPPVAVQPPVLVQPSVPSQPSYPAPSDPSGPSVVTLIGQLIHPVQDNGGAAVADQVVLVNLGNFQSTRGNLAPDGSFTFTNLAPRTRYCLSAWHHRRSSAGVVPGAAQGGAFEAKLSWHQAVVATRSGTYSVSLNPQNADPFYCVDQLLPSELPGRQSSLRPAELQLIQRQGYR